MSNVSRNITKHFLIFLEIYRMTVYVAFDKIMLKLIKNVLCRIVIIKLLRMSFEGENMHIRSIASN